MAFIAPKPPQQALDAMHATFLDLSRNRAFRTPALRNATGTLQLGEPQQVFTLDLTDLAAGKGLDAARPTGWRYLVQEGDNVLASAETVAGPRSLRGRGHSNCRLRLVDDTGDITDSRLVKLWR